MITEVMKISEPPYTNRGVTRQKEDLTALIDWCQITVKGVDVFIIIEDILRIPLSFMELHGKEKGIAGHELIARFDNIKTPCKVDGTCHDCNAPGCICSCIHILRNSMFDKRIKIILTEEKFGF